MDLNIPVSICTQILKRQNKIRSRVLLKKADDRLASYKFSPGI